MVLKFLTLLLLASPAVLAQSKTSSAAQSAPTQGYCYYPGANPASAQNDRPCDPTAETSLCCPIGWTCMSNKICQVTDGSKAQEPVGSIRRGTCTNPAWNDSVCGDFCLNLPTYDNQGDLTFCGDNVFACSAYAKDGSANCAAKQKVFTIPVGEAQTIINVPTGGTSTLPSSTRPTSTLVTSVRSSSSSSASADSSKDGGRSSKSNTTPIAVGATIGAVAALVIGAILFCCLKKRKDRKTKSLNSRYSPAESYSKATVAAPTRPNYSVPPVHTSAETPLMPPAHPSGTTTTAPLGTTIAAPSGTTLTAPDSDPHDGWPRHVLTDDHETEIATGGIARTVSPLSAVDEGADDRDDRTTTLTAPSYLGEIGTSIRGSRTHLRGHDGSEIEDDRATYDSSPRLGVRRGYE